MKKWLAALWPRPEEISPEEREAISKHDADVDARIGRLQDISRSEPAVYLEAARRIADEEDRRRVGAESRATTFIAALAALIPLMTWALGNTGPAVCSPGWGCLTWTSAFILAVLYFITGAYWALRSLAVANYHVIGVEDIVEIREAGKDIFKGLVRQTLLQARRNRDTINEKLTYISVAQRRFFNGLAVLGVLLMFDPMARLGVFEFVRSIAGPWVGSIYTALVQML